MQVGGGWRCSSVGRALPKLACDTGDCDRIPAAWRVSINGLVSRRVVLGSIPGTSK